MKKYVSLASFGFASVLFLSLAGCNKSADTTVKDSGSATSSSANTSIAKSSPAGASKTTSSPTEASWVGTWKPETSEGVKIQSLSIKADGSYTVQYNDASEDAPNQGSWSATGDGIELRSDPGKGTQRRMTGTLESEGRLVFREAGQKMVFVKS